MVTIKIIQASPGLSTTELILESIRNHPEGMTISELSQILNRPVSMLQICLKILIATKQVHARLGESKMHLLYYPKDHRTIGKAPKKENEYIYC